MKTILVIAAFLLMLPTSALTQSRFLCDREWHEVGEPPENLYQEFLKMPKTNVGIVDALLHKAKPQDGYIMIMGDLRDDIAVLFFKGVPGGTGFVIPEDWPYTYREYILEIRWLDHTTNTWRYWWNREKLDDTFLARPGLCPMASNSPF